MQGACFEPDVLLPYAPLIDLLRMHLAHRPLQEVQTVLGIWAPAFVKLLPKLALLLPSLQPTPHLDPEAEKRRLFDAFVHVFMGILFDGSSTLSAAEVLALEPLARAWLALAERAKHGHLLDYFAHKALWLAQHGYPQAGFHCMFGISAMIAGDCRQDATKAVQATALAQRWLAAIHWTGQPVLAAKVALAQSLLQEMERLAADLPLSA